MNAINRKEVSGPDKHEMLSGARALDALKAMHNQWFAGGDGSDGGDAGATGNDGKDKGTLAGGDGGQKLGWRAGLKDELKNHEAFKDMGSVNDLAVKYLDSNGRLAKSVTLPGEKADDKELGEFYSKLGRPESKDKYSFDKKQLPEGMQYSKEVEDWFREKAFAAGLSQKQAAKFFSEYSDLVVSQFTQETKARIDHRAKAEADLRAEWKENYDVNLKKAQKVTALLGGEDFAKYLSESGLGNDSRLVKAMFTIAELVGEDKLVKGSASKTGGSKRDPGVLSFPNTPGME